VAAAVIEPVGVSAPLNSIPLPVGFHGDGLELDEGADSDEPPAQRRRIEAEPVDFQIFVKTLTGATVILWVNRDSSIQSVKERLSDKLGWWMTRPGSLCLLFAGRGLENERNLNDYGIQENNLLHQASILPTGASENEDMEDMEPPEEEEGPPEEGPPEDCGIVHFLAIWLETQIRADTSSIKQPFT
jgi:large subunit ribosomal protein L40e